MAVICALLATLLFAVTTNVQATPISDATEQVLDIIADPSKYNREVRPPAPGPTNVTVNIFVRNIDLDDINMEFKLDMTFRMQWRDHRIRYNVPEVPSVTLVNTDTFWIPDAFFKNAVAVKQMESLKKEAYIRIDRNGNIIYSSRLYVHLSCPMDLGRFPHDVQECMLLLASYGYTTDDIIFDWKKNDPIQIVRITAERFSLQKFTTDYCNARTITGEYSCLSVRYELHRHFSAYLMEWYVPCLCMVIVAFCSQLLPIQNVLARLLITLAPLMTLMACAFPYTASRKASVTYVTAFDVYTGISFLSIFATLLHSTIGFYNANKKSQEAPQEEEPCTSNEEGEKKGAIALSKKEKLKKLISEKGDVITRGAIVGGYLVFLFLYILAYST